LERKRPPEARSSQQRRQAVQVKEDATTDSLKVKERLFLCLSLFLCGDGVWSRACDLFSHRGGRDVRHWVVAVSKLIWPKKKDLPVRSGRFDTSAENRR
jgi:hypothetical protein